MWSTRQDFRWGRYFPDSCTVESRFRGIPDLGDFDHGGSGNQRRTRDVAVLGDLPGCAWGCGRQRGTGGNHLS